jgi:predicted molibdopterin-dependent oxidoreductase YjgC
MLKIRIDGNDVEVADGTTVLEACRQQGIDVPTMCYLDGHTHFTSCMVCVVKDVGLGRLIPACSAPVKDGMELKTGTEEVADARRVAVELLLSEHVGDCEGPCERVCPAQIRIPIVIRKLAAGDRTAAAAVYRDSSTRPGVPCRECNGRCEKPCRRGQVDTAVSIRNLMLHAAAALDAPPRAPSPRPKRFNSIVGRLTDEEKAAVLEQAADYGRVEPVDQDGSFTDEEAGREAHRCLHCDCRKPESCELRALAEQYGAKQSRYRAAERKPLTLVHQHRDVVYEPGKCIKCGICVKITESAGEKLGMAFLRRGYDSAVGVPFDERLEDGLTETAAECVRCCPTGALAQREGEDDSASSTPTSSVT